MLKYVPKYIIDWLNSSSSLVDELRESASPYAKAELFKFICETNPIANRLYNIRDKAAKIKTDRFIKEGKAVAAQYKAKVAEFEVNNFLSEADILSKELDKLEKL